MSALWRPYLGHGLEEDHPPRRYCTCEGTCIHVELIILVKLVVFCGVFLFSIIVVPIFSLTIDIYH